MQLLRIGKGADGMIHDVRHVRRGVECGCRCVFCGHELVAKQGGILQWHFAHAGLDEREQSDTRCLHLQMQAMQRLAARVLKMMLGQSLRALPPYRIALAPVQPLQPPRVVQWQPQIEAAGIEDYAREFTTSLADILDDALQRESGQPAPRAAGQLTLSSPIASPVTSMRLSDGVELDVYIALETHVAERLRTELGPALREQAGERAAILVEIERDPHDERDLLGQIEAALRECQIEWLYHPDSHGALARAAAELAAERKLALHEQMQQRQRAAQQRWAPIVARQREGSQHPPADPGGAAGHNAEALPRASDAAGDAGFEPPGWFRAGASSAARPRAADPEALKAACQDLEDRLAVAPQPGTVYRRFQLRDAAPGQYWLLYRDSDAQAVALPWPQAWDGWDEELPPSVATPIEGVQAARLQDAGTSSDWFSSHSQHTRISGSLVELAQVEQSATKAG